MVWQPALRGIVRLHYARQVVKQRGTIRQGYTVARAAAEAFYSRLRQLFDQREQITTFGPYSPGQAVARAGVSAARSPRHSADSMYPTDLTLIRYRQSDVGGGQ